MRKELKYIVKLLLCGAVSSLCVANTQENEINSLRQELLACKNQRRQFLLEVDRTHCLPKLCALYKRLHQIEQKNHMTPIKKAEELTICELAAAQTESQQNKLCSDLATLDHSLAKIRRTHHAELSAHDRCMVELNKELLQQLSPEEKTKLKELSSQYAFLRQRLLAFDTNDAQEVHETSPRQDDVLDVLFL